VLLQADQRLKAPGCEVLLLGADVRMPDRHDAGGGPLPVAQGGIGLAAGDGLDGGQRLVNQQHHPLVPAGE
jgi:hypothetical protein